MASGGCRNFRAGAQLRPSSATTSLPTAVQFTLVGVGLPVTSFPVVGQPLRQQTPENAGRQQSLSFHFESTDFVVEGGARSPRDRRIRSSEVTEAIPWLCVPSARLPSDSIPQSATGPVLASLLSGAPAGIASQQLSHRRHRRAGGAVIPLRTEVVPMTRHSWHTLHAVKRAAAFKLWQLWDELAMLTASFSDLRDAFDPDELPLEFILKRDSQTDPSLSRQPSGDSVETG